MGTVFGMLGLIVFGLALLVVGLIVAVAAVRTLRLETLPRFAELRPDPLKASLLLAGSLGPQFVIAAFAVAAGLRAIQVALQVAGLL